MFRTHRSVNPLLIGAAALLAVVSLQSPAHAVFALFEDFEDVAVGSNLAAVNAGENFNVGTINATNGGSFTIQTGLLSNVLQSTVFQTGATASLGALSIPDGTTATLFYLIERFGNTGATAPDFNTGTSDQNLTPSTANNTGLFETQLNRSGATLSNFQIRDGAAFTTSQVNFIADRTFGIFQVINNTTDTTDFYVQTSTDVTPVLLTSTTSPFGFRNGTTTNALTNFLILQSGAAATQDTFYIDDIYVDLAGANTSSPIGAIPFTLQVPEPTSFAMLGLGIVALGGYRRLRRVA